MSTLFNRILKVVRGNTKREKDISHSTPTQHSKFDITN